jgi:hypothetical protein
MEPLHVTIGEGEIRARLIQYVRIDGVFWGRISGPSASLWGFDPVTLRDVRNIIGESICADWNEEGWESSVRQYLKRMCMAT